LTKIFSLKLFKAEINTLLMALFSMLELYSLKKKVNFLQGGCLHHRMGLELEYVEEFEAIFETVFG
jgi:hypothetical protein